MEKENKVEGEDQRSGMSRRYFFKTLIGISFISTWGTLSLFVSAEDTPTEPENLDVPTPWQEGDPDPVEKVIPAEEPEQTSAEAPPSQPIDDERPEPPDPDHVWVHGY